jgi:protein DJ-1
MKAVVLMANGTEEMEATTAIDILRRAEITVTACSVEEQLLVTCSRLLKVECDALLESGKFKDYDILVLPGGLSGADTFRSNQKVQSLMQHFCETKGKYLAVICAAPIALLPLKLAKGRKITSHPSVKTQFLNDYEYMEERVVHDGNLITSRGPGTAIEFALKIVEVVLGTEKRDEVASPMIL